MRRALVTGAASGLGRGLVTRLRERGDEVIAVDVDASVHDLGVRAFTCDVTDLAAMRGVRDEVGPVDLLFNNAGVTGDESARVIDAGALWIAACADPEGVLAQVRHFPQ